MSHGMDAVTIRALHVRHFQPNVAFPHPRGIYFLHVKFAHDKFALFCVLISAGADHASLFDGEEKPRRILTGTSTFLGFQCIDEVQSPITTNLFFSFYILLTSWVIMSLFIGVISSKIAHINFVLILNGADIYFTCVMHSTIFQKSAPSSGDV